MVKPAICLKCKQTHPGCEGHNVRGKPCGRPASRGATVCCMHGARAPQVKAAAERRLAEEAAHKAVVTFGLPRSIDPHSALLEELHRTAGHVAWLGSLVADLETDQLKQRDMSGKFEKAAIWVELYQSERAHFAKVAKAAIDAGIEERRVQLAEAQGELLAQVVRDILTDVFALLGAAGVAAEVIRRIQREETPGVVRRRFLEIAERSA